MSRSTEHLIGPLAYAPKWVRDAAIAERRSLGFAISEAHLLDDVRQTERFSEARSLDPVILPPPPFRSRLPIRFAILGGMAMSAAAGAITALFVVGQLPPWGIVTKDDSLGAPSFETRFIGDKYQTPHLDQFSDATQLAFVNIARQWEHQGIQLAEPLRQVDQVLSATTEGAGQLAPVKPELEPLRRSTAEPATSTTTAEPLTSTTTEGQSPAPSANQESRVAEPLRETTADQPSNIAGDGARPLPPANQESRLVEPLQATADQVLSTTTEGARQLAPVKPELEPLRGSNAEPATSTTTAEPLTSTTTEGQSPAPSANQESRVAEPLRETTADQPSNIAGDSARPLPANRESRLVEPLQATADQSSSTAAEAPSAPAPANEQSRLFEPTHGSTVEPVTSTTEAANQPSNMVGDSARPLPPANEELRLADPVPGVKVEHHIEPRNPSATALNRDAIAAFLKSGQELMASGDITAARIILLRAAEARDPEAALALAATFDPIFLERNRAHGIVPDVPSARRWYEKAKEFGSEEALQRLEMLARRRAPAIEEPRLAEPLRQATTDRSSSRETDGASPTARANQEPRLPEALRGLKVEHHIEPRNPSASALNPDAIAAFLRRGQEMIASGDIAGARVLLLRAAEARDPEAALALAATFDPIMLERIRAYGIVPDILSARRWYEKAKEFGSEEAPRRLEMLARRGM